MDNVDPAFKGSNKRQEKGKEIANTQDQIRRIDNHTYKVKSQSGNGEYDVVSTESGWNCNCKDHTFRQVCCKHIHAVEFSLKLREQVKKNVIIYPVKVHSCQFCNSDKIVKNAIRHNKYGDLQRYLCKSCNKRFSINLGFEGMRSSPQTITSAMQLYFTGESLRNVQKFLRLQGVEVSHKTVYKWIKKYIGLMEKYLEQITPQVSDTWRADEIFLKVKGNTKYLYALLDDQTRFWIAQQVSNNKYKDDISQMLRDGKEITGKKPTVFITDGAYNFHQAYRKEFWANAIDRRTLHIRHIHFKHDMNNNKMERLNGEIRDREKTMRGLKKMDTPILTGYQIYHNYVRPHMALDGKTPSEACGIKINGDNKWLTLIQNAKFSSSDDMKTQDRGWGA